MVEDLIKFLRENAEKNDKKLPKIEDFPLKDQTLFVLYQQTYAITKIGLPTASLIMQGVLMEHFIKYLYYHHKRKEYDGRYLKRLIKKCGEENLFSKVPQINEIYYSFFERFNENIRIPQVHLLSQKQTKGMDVLGQRIKGLGNPSEPKDVINFFNRARNAADNVSQGKGERLSTAEHLAVANALKIDMDNKIYLEQFCELNEAIVDLNKINNLDHSKK